MEIREDGLRLTEIAPGHTPEEIQARIEPMLHVDENLTLMYEE